MECCWERSNGGAKNYMKKRWRIRKNNACRRESEKMFEEDKGGGGTLSLLGESGGGRNRSSLIHTEIHPVIGFRNF